MRLTSVSVSDVPPVGLFQASDLADVVVVAGPNGVGKSRLLNQLVNYLRAPQGQPNIAATVAATSSQEANAWGKRELKLQDPQDAGLFMATIQQSRFRRNWTSSLINFESDRSIRNVQPFQPTWDITDPDEEQVGWDLTWSFLRDRFSDTLHAMFRMIEAQRRGIATRAVQLKRSGEATMALNFQDPMAPFKSLFSRLLSPKELVDPSPRTQSLQYIQDGQEFDISALSSGEREVLNIAFDFQIRSPQDCIVFFDEPELHLHPELSYRLLQALQEIGRGNQFIFATHSPDIISASLDRSVIFLSPPRRDDAGQPVNQAVAVEEDDDANRALRLLGQSIGIIALGRRIVLIEGLEASLDKQLYGSILRNEFPELVLVPSGGKHLIESFDAVHTSVLSRSLWGVEFFMLCDGDTAPGTQARAEAISTGRLRLLPRYHLENYFLDEATWAAALTPLEAEEAWARDPTEIRSRLKQLAFDVVSYATALGVAAELRFEFGNISIMPKDCHGKSSSELAAMILARSRAETARLTRVLDDSRVTALVDERYSRLMDSLTTDSDEWQRLIPGRPLLNRLAGALVLSPARAKRLYIRAAEDGPTDPFAEVRAIFAAFAADA